MNSRLLLTAFIVVGPLLAPVAVRAADGDSDRAHPTSYVKDSVITTKIKTKLAADKLGSLTQIHVDTDRNGVVVLSGSAKSQERADAAVSIARATEGVTSVRNDIKIKSE
jgi:hyperosmotically inducible protein